MSDAEISMKNPDYVEISGTRDGLPTHTEIELTYPDIYSPAGVRTTLQIGMMHTRAGQSIRLSYEAARDGWVVEKETQIVGDSGGEWVEVAFVESWVDGVEE